MIAQPRIAFFDFAGCEGDQLQVANLEEVILDLVRHVEIAAFREAVTGDEPPYDIAFVEGSITRPEDEDRLRGIREQSKLLIALGACAATGGVNCLKSLLGADEYRELVYGEQASLFNTYQTRPLSAVVKVDAELHGCPVDRTEMLRVVKDLLLGKQPFIPDYPVCVECKQQGNVCRLHLGQPCLGIITRAGCNACCVSEGATCWGCRGLAPEANLVAARHALLVQHGFKPHDVAQLASLHLTCSLPRGLDSDISTGGDQA